MDTFGLGWPGRYASLQHKYPIAGGRCEDMARAIAWSARTSAAKAGKETTITIWRVRLPGPYVRTVAGELVGEQGFHVFTQVGTLYYDAITGPQGNTWEEYLKLYEYWEGLFKENLLEFEDITPELLD